MATPNETPLTLWQRIMADSPAFWKKVNLIGLALGAVVAAVATNVPTFPKTWLALAAGLSAAIVGLSQFAVTGTAVLEKPDASLQDYVNTAKDLTNQYNEIKTIIDTTIKSVKTDPPGATIKAEDIPIVKDEPVVVTTQAVQELAKPIEVQSSLPPEQPADVISSN